MNKSLAGAKNMKKPPEIRQTLTSKYRLLRANPLLALEVAKKIAPNGDAKEHLLKPLKTLVRAMDNRSIRPNSRFKPELKKPVGESSDKEDIKRGSKPPPSICKRSLIPKKDLQLIPKVTVNSTKGIATENDPTEPKPNVLSVIQEVITPKTPKAMVFKTPNTNRKSVFLVHSEKKNRLSTPRSAEISSRLSDWLQKKGKSFEDYNHLKCFGINCQKTRIRGKHATSIEENKENEVLNQREDANCSFVINEENANEATPIIVIEVQNEDLELVAREALIDLHKLILEGYPPEQCDIWLKLIKQKCNKLEEEVQYWECRAALEQSKGNINLAVECCKAAIVQGAEVQQAEAFLEQLLQKFSLLNIGKETEKATCKEREKIVEEARNVFKSSIIQFAVQERTLKKKSKEGLITIEKSLIATPVRRSTRLSRSGFTITPGVKIYSSLKDLDGDIKENLKFETNYAFKD